MKETHINNHQILLPDHASAGPTPAAPSEILYEKKVGPKSQQKIVQEKPEEEPDCGPKLLCNSLS